MLTITKYPDPSTWDELLKRPQIDLEYLQSSVRNILNRVQQAGDKALFEFTSQFDQVELDRLNVTAEEVKSASEQLDPELKDAIKTAYSNIYAFHAAQKRDTLKLETMKGVTCWRKSIPIQSVGIYIPGGTAPLFSSVLMLGIPAKIAECPEVVLCTPPNKENKIDPAILFAADLVGVTKIYKVGGAQAVAAMAYGTETVPQVNKIFGPGNQYVTAAKQLVSLGNTAIDMPAGPSEVAILADDFSDADFVAADLLSQAEHGIDSQVVLASTSEQLLNEVQESIRRQIQELPRKDIAEACLKNSVGILLKSSEELIALSNYYAPEHLIIATENSEEDAAKITNAGSVFIGNFTPESAGDYASGTNHTLPTNGAATAYSGVSLDSFFKQITYQKITAEGIQNIGPAVEKMAAAEQLEAHKRAITVRLKKLKES